MSLDENIQTVKDFFASMSSSNPQDLLALVAEDIEWIIPGEGWALAGTHRGHAGVTAVLRRASQEIEMTYPTPPEFVAQGDRVLVVGVATGKVKATNMPFHDEWIFDITVRDGKLRRFRSMSTATPWRGPARCPRPVKQIGGLNNRDARLSINCLNGGSGVR